ncbi:hypothetical protein P170DRAFT_487854 [Aspergillus steynii IBT 23096]|uniref:SnoaL-like domain-containing protein n=1 Tax=Aspergillus steynii IBT 23096 TaxID=1392250 RepID=A0A2I2GFJ3_9EURO|nr:uncharacterized protein P170DRAFT_487854 [Aspergillus steynii IBT 23096]PLB51649.1 hypothetical protein P170DRAFT_487854 [Aspergillus steynii IBT 23096]
MKMTSTLHRTTLNFLEVFETLSLEKFLSVLTPDAEYIIAPASSSMPVLKVGDNFAEHVRGLNSILDGFPMFPKEILENEEKGQVTIWATSLAGFKDEVKDSGLSEEEWAYRGEYIIIVTMDETREKIVRVVEFMDSRLTERLKVLFSRAKKNLDKIKAEEKEQVGDR